MHHPNYPPCRSCGFYHQRTNRASGREVAATYTVENTEETPDMEVGSIIVDVDGDLWHLVSREANGRGRWWLQSNNTDFTCADMREAAKNDYNNYPDGHRPHYRLSDGRPNIDKPPKFATPEEADAWLEAHA